MKMASAIKSSYHIPIGPPTQKLKAPYSDLKRSIETSFVSLTLHKVTLTLTLRGARRAPEGGRVGGV